MYVQIYTSYICQCNLPYIGNNDICGLDSDGDGCPDDDLGCPEENCRKVCTKLLLDNNISCTATSYVI